MKRRSVLQAALAVLFGSKAVDATPVKKVVDPIKEEYKEEQKSRPRTTAVSGVCVCPSGWGMRD